MCGIGNLCDQCLCDKCEKAINCANCQACWTGIGFCETCEEVKSKLKPITIHNIPSDVVGIPTGTKKEWVKKL